MDWEFSVLNYIDSIHNSVLDKIMIGFSTIGDFGTIWIAITILLLISKKYRIIGITSAVSLIIMLVSGNLIMKNIFNRIRPYEIINYSILIDNPSGSSFPSGHTFSSFASATAIFLWKRNFGVLAYILAFIIGFSRMYLYVHFPTDVIGGAVFGVISGVLSYYLVKYLKGKQNY